MAHKRNKRRILVGMKIKHQLIVLVGSSIAALFFFLLLYGAALESGKRAGKQETLRGVAGQIINELNSFDTDMKRIMRTLAYNQTVRDFIESEDPGQRYMLSRELQLIAESAQISNPRIDALAFTDLKQIVIGSQTTEFLQMLHQLQSIQADVPEDGIGVYRTAAGQLAIVSASFRSGASDGRYYIVASCNLEPVQKILESIDTQTYRLILYGKDGEPFFSQAKETAPKWDSGKGEGIFRRTDNGEWIVQGQVISGIQNVWRSVGTMALAAGIFTVIFCAAGMVIYRSVVSPIEEIIRFMERYGKYYNKERLAVRGPDEIEKICSSVNRMLEDIQEMTRRIVNTQDRLYMAELAKRQAEVTALQIQMNPHFLYNTLDCLRGIALVKKAPEAAEIAGAMSKILRYSMGGNKTVRLEEEMACIREYLQIVQIRHQNRYAFSIQIEEGLEKAEIPKMILQPIVENAVFYGLEKSSKGGRLWIAVRSQGEQLQIEVDNTGAAIDADKLSELQAVFEENKTSGYEGLFANHCNIGLKNIDKRIKILYGTQYGLSISREQEGTVVTILLPVQKNRK